jgi:HK97 family phage major capsid protein
VNTIPTAATLRTRPPGLTLAQHLDEIRDALVRHGAEIVRLTDEAEAKKDQRQSGSWLASERRAVDKHVDEEHALQVLLRELESSPEARAVDYSQVVMTGGGSGAGHGTGQLTLTNRRVLTPQDSLSEWARRNQHGDDEHGESLRLGPFLRGWLTSRWDGAPAEQRALLEGTQAGGGVLVPTPLSAAIIDRARVASRAMSAGARTVPMTSETLKVPRIAGSPGPAWRSENAPIAEGDLMFDAVTFKAKSLALIVRASRELIEDGQNVDDVIEADLAAQIATELDRVMLRGTGEEPEPAGVRNSSGVTIIPSGANGAAPTYDILLDGVQAVRAGNHEPSAIITSPRSLHTLEKLKTTDGQYLAPPPALAAMRMLTTNQVPGNLAAGTSTDASEIYIGDWSRLWLGLRTSLILTPLTERYADFGQVGFVAWLRADVQLSHPAAFAVITGVRP